MVGAAFAAMFTAFGIAYSFGAFFEPMADEFGSGRGATSVFSSLTYSGLGAVSGAAVEGQYGSRGGRGERGARRRTNAKAAPERGVVGMGAAGFEPATSRV